jgi:hypothetical protein
MMPKNTNPLIVIHNAETGERIEREMNAAEIAQMEIDAANAIAAQAEAQAKETAHAAILDRLGITAEEAQLLRGGN